MNTAPPPTDQIVLLLIAGANEATVESHAIHALKLDPPAAKAAVIDARRRITIAADYNREEQLGQSIMRLNDIYRRAVNEADYKTALAAQKEINRLLQLYAASPPPSTPIDEDPAASAQTLRLIAEHLLPLDLAPADYPLHEHARIAAGIVRDTRTQPPTPPAAKTAKKNSKKAAKKPTKPRRRKKLK